jgi:DNA-binding transcriptional MerR regulator
MTTDDVRFPWEVPDAQAPRPEPAEQAAAEEPEPPVGAARTPAEPGEDAEPWAGAATASADGETEPWSAPGDADGETSAAEEPDDGADAWQPAARSGEEEPAVEEAATAREKPIAPREYYSISEVCDLVDLKPHVLRYWETQFPVLNPSKNRSGNRVYQRKEIKLIQLVKHLLYDEKYTVEGAKQRLERMRRGGELPAATAAALDGQTLALLRADLRRLSELLAPSDPA